MAMDAAQEHNIFDLSRSASARLRVLILEDSPQDVELCIRELKKAGFELHAEVADSEEVFAAKLECQDYDLILSDYRMPAWSGIEAFRFLRQSRKDIPFILVTGTLGEEAAVELIKEGVTDYILKDRLIRLPSAVRQALHEKKARDEHERAIKSLRESEETVRLLLDSTAEAIYGMDALGNCTFCNAASLRLLGYDSPKELLGKQMHWLMHHTRADGTPYPLEECKIYKGFHQAKGSHADDEVLWRKDGYSFPAEYWAYPVIRDGKAIGSVVTFLDITERKRAGTLIRKERDRAQQYLDIVEVILLALDLKGRITLINRKGCSTLGWSEHELLGRSWIDTCIPFRARDELKELFDSFINGEHLSYIEKAVLTKSGEERMIGWRNSLLRDAAGRIVGTLSSGEDITETKRMQEMFRQAQKMEAVGRLAGGVAHDFNNLLGVIIGYGEIVEERLSEDDPLRSKVEQIKKAGQRAAGLTRQLLAFSRQQVLEPKILNLNAVVADIQKMLQRLIGEDIQLITILCPQLASTKADQGQIEQVIMNLAVNSRDAMPEGGKLTIETANVELDAPSVLNHPELVTGSFVMLRVSDTGTGMDVEIQKHVFEPFFTTKEPGKGTGLGLATVYGVVKQSGGYVSLHSELGQGTTFTIYLPRVQAAVEAEPQGVGMNSTFEGTETILLVEDEESLRKLTREVLMEGHYTVLEATDGLEALGVAAQHKGPIHLLLTDVVMPRMGGPALAKQLAIKNPEMKVLFMSGYAGNTGSRQALPGPQSHFLQKPFTRASLASKLREVLGMFEEQAVGSPTEGIEKDR